MMPMTPLNPREVELLDPDVWDAPPRLSPADCWLHTGLEGRRSTRNLEDNPEETDT